MRLYNHNHITVHGDAVTGIRVLFLHGIPVMSTVDAHRTYECLSVVPYLFTRFARHILIMGGGTGQSATALLSAFPDAIHSITIVDPDEELVKVSRGLLNFPLDDRVSVVHQPPMAHLNGSDKKWGMVLIDYPVLPDPHLAGLYTVEAFSTIRAHLSKEGSIGIRCCSMFLNPKAASCMIMTAVKAFPDATVIPYRVHTPASPLPSQQGFCLVAQTPQQLTVPPGLRFLNPAVFGTLFALGNDEVYPPMPESTSANVLYYNLLSELYVASMSEEVE